MPFGRCRNEDEHFFQLLLPTFAFALVAFLEIGVYPWYNPCLGEVKPWISEAMNTEEPTLVPFSRYRDEDEVHFGSHF